MGLGRFGGGVGVSRWLADQGAHVLVTDTAPEEQLSASIEALSGSFSGSIRLRLGEHRESDFASADLVVINPAVKPFGNPYIEAARSATVPITTEMRLLIKRLPNRNRVIGITGTAGKSTTTAMIGHILRATSHEVHVGGNLGGSLLQHLTRIDHDDWVVLELSSFMLHWLDEIQWSPHIAVVTNLQPNHLDWHLDAGDYYTAKAVLLKYQSHDDCAVVGPRVEQSMSPAATNIARVSDSSLTATGPVPLLIPGHHNQLNAAAAIATTGFAGVETCDAVEALADFPGLPHRLQFVCERNNVTFFNDSKSTTPEAAILAIESFPHGTVHAILGGYDKGADLTKMAQSAASRCAAVYTIGDTGNGIANAVERNGRAIRCSTLEIALGEIASRVRSGDVVLLSPGCASWDQFEHFEQRGDSFVDAVTNLNFEI